MERRTTPADLAPVRLHTRDDGGQTIVGYAAVFYDGTPRTEYELWTDTVERIMPGAFDRAIAEDDVRGLFNHDANQVLGRNRAPTRKLSPTMKLSVDETGLRYQITRADTTVARDVAAHLERGDVSGSSFSFIVTDEDWRKEEGRQIREIKGVQLYDVGPVTFPAYTATTAGNRAVDGAAEARKSLEAWEAGKRRQRGITMDRTAQARELESGA